MQLWDVTNFTPFASFGGFERDHSAESYWCVWIKAEFQVSPEGHVVWRRNKDLKISPAPESIETPRGDMMLDEADIALPRAATDISLIGTGKIPAQTTRPLTASLSVGAWSKAIEVHPASRLSARKIVVDGPSNKQEELSLDWTHAFGGKNTDSIFEENPLGTGFHPNREKSEDVILPRLRYPGEQLKKVTDMLRPASFLPVSRAWVQRSKLAGTFDDNWAKTRAPLLPQDHNPEYRSSVPPDQRYSGFLVGGERVEMRNISGVDNNPIPGFTLPTLGFEVLTRLDGAWVPTPMTIQALVLRPSSGTFTLMWCGAIPIGSPANDVKIQQSTIVLKTSSGFTVTPEDVPAFGQENEDAFGDAPVLEKKLELSSSEEIPNAGND